MERRGERLVAAIDVPHFLYRWAPDDPENPYFGILANADRIIATADSVSMMAEACATGRPVYLYDTGEGSTSMRDAHVHIGFGRLSRMRDRTHRKAVIYRLTMRYGPSRLTRDIRIVQRRLVYSGRAAWLGAGHPAGAPPPLRDLERAVQAVRALFDRGGR
jgi:hypothetical protein